MHSLHKQAIARCSSWLALNLDRVTDVYNYAVRAVVCENPRQLLRCCAASGDERCVTKVVSCCAVFTPQLEGVNLKTESALGVKYVSEGLWLCFCSGESLRQTFANFVVHYCVLSGGYVCHITANLTKLLFAFTSCIGSMFCEKATSYVTMCTKRW